MGVAFSCRADRRWTHNPIQGNLQTLPETQVISFPENSRISSFPGLPAMSGDGYKNGYITQDLEY